MTITNIIELSIILALAIGYIFEEPIARWERKTAHRIINKLKGVNK